MSDATQRPDDPPRLRPLRAARGAIAPATHRYRDACRRCGRRVTLDTDGDGQLVERNEDDQLPHACPADPEADAAFEAEIERHAARRGPSMFRSSMGPRPADGDDAQAADADG